MNIEIKTIANYLANKGISFMVKTDYETGIESFIGITITKKDKFYRANGIIISGNMARGLI